MRYSVYNRILSFILVIAMLCADVAFPVNSVEIDNGKSDASVSTEQPFDYTTLKITKNGISIREISVNYHEKVEISADGVENATKYQWQVLHPEREDLWVDIVDGTDSTIGVSTALVGSVLGADGTAQLRCRAYSADAAYQTEPVIVTIVQDASADNASETMFAAPSNQLVEQVSDSVDPGDGQDPEFVTIKLNYLQFDFQPGTDLWQDNPQVAFDPYVATLLYNGPLGEVDKGLSILIPSLVGYDAYLAGPSVEPIYENWEYDNINLVMEDGKLKAINLDYQEHITTDIELTILYLPASVDYVVYYYFQNIYDDNYVEKTELTTQSKGLTGQYPDKDLVERRFDGFSAMYYQPASIAADGSTVFKVYYERNYYLVDIVCNGGYGAAPVYVRYESFISVPDPIRVGWDFQHWDMTGAWDDENNSLQVKRNDAGGYEVCDADGIEFNDADRDDLPLTMPCFNTSFAAIWEETEAAYTVAYWIRDEVPNGNKHTFLGSRTVNSQTDDPIEITDDFASLNIKVCSATEHQSHTNDCYDCQYSDDVDHVHHAHGLSCYNMTDKGGVEPTDMEGINAVNEDQDPTDGVYFYFIYQTGRDDYWPKIYYNDQYYTVYINGNKSISSSGDAYTAFLNTFADSTTEKEATWNDGEYHVKRYKAKECTLTACEMILTCGIQLHTHSSACNRNLADYVEYDEAFTLSENEDLTVNGDGSTVINLYYTYKTFEIRFVYARSTSDDPENGPFQLADLTGDGTLGGSRWNYYSVSTLPTITGDLNGSDPRVCFDGEDGYYYYYISLQAKYGADISGLWPTANVQSIEGYVWGSWAVEAGTPYRELHASNANIVGTYNTMSAEMIKENPTELDNGVWLAQTMIAWWGGSGIGNHSFHNYKEVYNPSQELKDRITSTDGRNPSDGQDGNFYIKREYKNEQGEDAVKYYVLVNDWFVSNHDGDTRVFPTTFIGYDLYDAESFTNLFAYQASNSVDGVCGCTVCASQDCDYCNVFLYDLTVHRIRFWNVNGYLGNGEGSPWPYGVSMSVYENYFKNTVNMDEQFYPQVYEKGAYKFVSWYTTPNFVPGTEVDWSENMPDSDFTVYAYWEPVKHTVCFYLDYDALKAGSLLSIDGLDNPKEVDHGAYLEEGYHSYEPEKQGYTFNGWFYFDGVEKKRFSPASMAVNKNLNLFAEWYITEGEPTTYKVTYVNEQGDEIADPTTGHSSVGRTKTFVAKGGTDLYENYRQNYFPRTASHSILMNPLVDEQPNPNTYEFEYVYDSEVYYKLVFLDIADNSVILDEIVKSTTNAVVTERYIPKTGYVPLPGYFYQTKALKYDGDIAPDGEGNVEVDPENVIVFYYIKDEEHSAYSIEYYLADLNVNAAPVTYSLKTSFVNTADLKDGDAYNVIDSNEEFQLLVFDGFTLDHAEVVNYQPETDGQGNAFMEEQVTEIGDPQSGVQGTIDENGLTIRLYYSRNTVDFTVKYVDNDTKSVLHTEPSSGQFGETISRVAPLTYLVGNVNYQYYQKDATEQQRTKTMSLRTVVADDPSTPENDESVVNELVFYYLKPVLTINYRVVCTMSDVTGFGAVTYSSETSSSGTITGSTAIAAYGFTFVGWYTDAACTIPATNDDAYKNVLFKPADWPTEGDSVTYYALFAPVLTSMTMRVVVKNGLGNSISVSDTFLVHIRGMGKTEYVDIIVPIKGTAETVVIEGLPVGSYTLTLLSEWSWRYTCSGVEATNVVSTTEPSDAKSITFVSEDDPSDVNIITFTNIVKDVDWLANETGQEYPNP